MPISIRRYLRKNHLAILGCVLTALGIPFVSGLLHPQESAVVAAVKNTEPNKSISTNNVRKGEVHTTVLHKFISGTANETAALKESEPTASKNILPQHSSSSTNKSKSTSSEQIEMHNLNYATATIKIVGSNNEILIKQGKSNVPFRGVNIVGSGGTRTLYVPLGQSVHIIITGSNNDIIAATELQELISVEEIGSNNDLR